MRHVFLENPGSRGRLIHFGQDQPPISRREQTYSWASMHLGTVALGPPTGRGLLRPVGCLLVCASCPAWLRWLFISLCIGRGLFCLSGSVSSLRLSPSTFMCRIRSPVPAILFQL